jgi:predicted protein tyrosine phosphatase
MTNNLTLLIMPRCELPAAHEYECTNVISIFESAEASKDKTETPAGISPLNHFRFYFDDITQPIHDLIPPSREHVEEILNKYPRLIGAKTFVHCFAGVSRSSAAVLALYAKHLGPGKESEAMNLTVDSAPFKGIWPNELIVEYADDLLERNGILLKALRSWQASQRNRVYHPPLERYTLDDYIQDELEPAH